MTIELALLGFEAPSQPRAGVVGVLWEWAESYTWILDAFRDGGPAARWLLLGDR